MGWGERILALKIFAHILSVGASFEAEVEEPVFYDRNTKLKRLITADPEASPVQAEYWAVCSLLLLMNYQDTGTMTYHCLLKYLFLAVPRIPGVVRTG